MRLPKDIGPGSPYHSKITFTPFESATYEGIIVVRKLGNTIKTFTLRREKP